IVPLRPYRADSGILPEQTLGRGLRRMFPFQDTLELVTVVEHPAFVRLYEEELQQEGLDIGVIDVNQNVKTSTSIFVDTRKPLEDLDIKIPHISDSVLMTSELQGLTIEEIQDYFDDHFRVLPIGERKEGFLNYTERQLFTDEVVAKMKFDLGLLERSWSASAYFAREIGRACHLTSSHKELTPLIEEFISKILFEREVDIYSGEIDHRMRDVDVAEHIRATFTPLILEKTIKKTTRKSVSSGTEVSQWKPYQVTVSPYHPVVEAQKTLFNLVPCDFAFEKEFADFCDFASDVVSFVKNAGPQKLMIDYQTPNGNRALYVPDFFIKTDKKMNYLVELKGRTDPNVPVKARAALDWCKTSSKAETKWEYIYIPYQIFSMSAPSTMEELARACVPSLQGLINEAKTQQLQLPLEEATAQKREDDIYLQKLQEAGITDSPKAYTEIMRTAVRLLDQAERSRMPTLAHSFQPLLSPLDELALRILEKRLKSYLPNDHYARQEYFEPYTANLPAGYRNQIVKNQRYLLKNLIYGQSIQRIGLLQFCLDFALNHSENISGIWKDISRELSGQQFRELYEILELVNNFRNTRVAHVEEPLTDVSLAWKQMIQWLKC
ncbi:MAG: restriction endonuclease subunit R, partial [Methanomicrobiales archaeon]|nr:restriction endonuclease subunit R [Methanomicrobiales archaeon]